MQQILITGGSDGIGLAAARLLAVEGTQLTLVARHAPALQAAVATLPGTGHRYLAADLATAEGLSLVAQLLDEQRFDVFLNNAGAGLYGRFEALPLARQLALLRLNVEAVTVLAHCYLTRVRPGDALVNTASFVGFTSLPGAAVYAAAKAYVASLSESLWWEYKRRGVYVLGFNPGPTDTGFHGQAGGSRDTFPAANRQTPDEVARELVRALHRRRKPRVVSGALNRLILFGQRWLPRAWAVSIMGRIGPAKAA